jgi:uncharacterized protein (DUF4415 family)
MQKPPAGVTANCAAASRTRLRHASELNPISRFKTHPNFSPARRVGRPTVGDEPRRLIAIRLDAKVLGWLRKTAEKKGLPHQSLVNEILASEMRKGS